MSLIQKVGLIKQCGQNIKTELFIKSPSRSCLEHYSTHSEVHAVRYILCQWFFYTTGFGGSVGEVSPLLPSYVLLAKLSDPSIWTVSVLGLKLARLNSPKVVRVPYKRKQ